MMRYTDTEIYRYMVARAQADIRFLTEVHDRLAGIKLRGRGVKERRKKTPEEQKTFTNASNGIKSATGRLNALLNLTAPTYDLLHILMEADGTLWSPAEAAMWNKELLDQSEGRGEEALKIRHGIPSDASTRECDLIKRDANGNVILYEEIKSLQEKSKNKEARSSLQEIQTGARGRHLSGLWMLEHSEAGLFKHLDDATRLALGTGELTSTCIENLSPFLNESITKEMMPSNVLGIYSAVNGTTKDGFIRIPREHFDAAWAFTHVTKSGPKFMIKKSYVAQRLLTTRPEPEFVNFMPESLEDVYDILGSRVEYGIEAEIEIVENMPEELDWEVIGSFGANATQESLLVDVLSSRSRT